MNLYHIKQKVVTGWDTYSDAVVAAPDEQTAKSTHPSGDNTEFVGLGGEPQMYTWCQPHQVEAVLIGVASAGVEAGVICASFHAG